MSTEEKEPLLSPYNRRVQEPPEDTGTGRGSAILAPFINTMEALKKERVRYVAAFSFVVCLGSLLVGMSLGFSSTTILELDKLVNGTDHKHGIEDNSELASLFGVRIPGIMREGLG